MLYADYSARALTGLELQAAGFGGAVRYAGTPGRSKNTSAAEVSSLHASAIDVHGVFENSTTDYTGGHGAGVANATALLNDADACGITGVLFMSADQHLTSSQLPLWQQYLQGAQTVLGPRTGAYGFSEAIVAAKAVGVTNLWQCGSRSSLVAGANLYQRNTGGTTVTGIAVDINDLITPFEESTVGNLQDTDPDWIQLTARVHAIFNNLPTAGSGLSFAPPAPGEVNVLATVLTGIQTAASSVTLSAAEFTTLTQDVAAAVSGAVGTLNLSVSTSDQEAIANAVAAELAARLSA